MYLPAYVFKIRCADHKKGKVNFPYVFRDIWMTKNNNLDILQDICNYKRKSDNDIKNEKYSLNLKCLNNKNLVLDVIPYIYQIIHPNIRDINV